ncbi:MAG: decaprenyl-phosphate phosphoribosyltransferase [Hydrogenophilales bacterium]|nr:decaprenyl-phosphate phosphoribosyltransferase [Hydrogenophilales bacterium]
MNAPLELIRLLRPKQWVKSLFVFVGLLFGHAWGDASVVWRVFAAAGGFALVSSCVYILNDIADREADRRHPVKRNRPLARGSVSLNAAVVLALVAGTAGGVLGYYASPLVAMLLALYGLMNIAYTLGLKRVVILDVFIIAAGFMLRLLAGTSGVGIPPSQWLLLCGLMLTLFLGFVKRRAELGNEDDDKTGQRKVLRDYSAALLDPMITVTAACIVMSYSLYTLSVDTIAKHGTSMLMLTVPFVIYGVFRYLFLLHQHSQGEDPASEALQDPHLVITLLAWLAVTLWLIAR